MEYKVTTFDYREDPDCPGIDVAVVIADTMGEAVADALNTLRETYLPAIVPIDLPETGEQRGCVRHAITGVMEFEWKAVQA